MPPALPDRGYAKCVRAAPSGARTRSSVGPNRVNVAAPAAAAIWNERIVIADAKRGALSRAADASRSSPRRDRAHGRPSASRLATIARVVAASRAAPRQARQSTRLRAARRPAAARRRRSAPLANVSPSSRRQARAPAAAPLPAQARRRPRALARQSRALAPARGRRQSLGPSLAAVARECCRTSVATRRAAGAAWPIKSATPVERQIEARARQFSHNDQRAPKAPPRAAHARKRPGAARKSGAAASVHTKR